MNQLPETANGVLSLLASTSTQIDVFSDQVIDSVKQGNESPLKVYVQLKAFEKCSERILKEIKENCITEADKFPGQSFEYMGNQFQKADTYTKYDYSACNDPEWNRLAKEIDGLEHKLKEREMFLKAIQGSFSLLDETSGEVVQLHPPKVNRSGGLKLTIK